MEKGNVISRVFNRKHLLIIALVLLIMVAFTACAEKETPDISALITDADLYFEKGEYESALNVYKKACEQDKASIEAYRGLSRTIHVLNEKNSETYPDEEVFNAYYTYYYLRGFESVDFDVFADLNFDKGDDISARDLLEQAQRIYPDSERQTKINGIVIDAANEEEEVGSNVSELFTLLSADDKNGAVSMLASSDWLETMAPKIYEGYRNYTYTPSENPANLKIKVGYITNGEKSTVLWFTDNSDVIYIKVGSKQIVISNLTLSDRVYTGAFETVCIDAGNGSVLSESGSFVNGVLSGNISSKAYFNSAEKDLISLYAKIDELSYEAYTGAFTQTGAPSAKQQSEATKAGGVVYAYNSNNTKYIYALAPNGYGVSNPTFDFVWFGILAYPEW